MQPVSNYYIFEYKLATLEIVRATKRVGTNLKKSILERDYITAHPHLPAGIAVLALREDVAKCYLIKSKGKERFFCREMMTWYPPSVAGPKPKTFYARKPPVTLSTALVPRHPQRSMKAVVCKLAKEELMILEDKARRLGCNRSRVIETWAIGDIDLAKAGTFEPRLLVDDKNAVKVSSWVDMYAHYLIKELANELDMTMSHLIRRWCLNGCLTPELDEIPYQYKERKKLKKQPKNK